jgi:hypothetical protein
MTTISMTANYNSVYSYSKSKISINIGQTRKTKRLYGVPAKAVGRRLAVSPTITSAINYTEANSISIHLRKLQNCVRQIKIQKKYYAIEVKRTHNKAFQLS